jgi:putative membrane protein
MFLDILLFILLGVGIGVFSGLCPGMHVNTTIPMILALSLMLGLSPYQSIAMIVAVGMTEMFVDLIPSVYLGAPDADTALSVLPGHRLLHEGRGYEAVKLAVIGGVGSLLFSLLLIVIFAQWFQSLYEMSRPYIAYVILAVIAYMIISERKPRKIAAAALIILASGLLGILTLNSSLVPQGEVLFPVLTGMFGLSGLFTSLNESSSLPAQKEKCDLLISKKNIIKSIVLASIGGIVVGFLPAVGISEAAVMLQSVGGSGPREFLMTTSGINTANDVFSLISLWLMGNPRSGSSVAVQKLVGEIGMNDVVLLVGATLLAAGIGALLALKLGKTVPKMLMRINYRLLTVSIIALVVAMVLVLTGPWGLLIAFTSASVGMLCMRLGVRRSHCMGVLLLSTLLFFTGLTPSVISALGI